MNDSTLTRNERQRKTLEQQKRLGRAAWNEYKKRKRPVFVAVLDWLKHVRRNPAYLDLCMRTGLYEEHLAESHGDTEDVFV